MEPYILRDRRLGGRAFDFWIADPVAEVWYARQCHDEPDKLWCLDHVRPEMTVIDCGAHHGQMTVAFAMAAKRVIAFDALFANAMVVERNLRLNHLRNAEIYPYALGDREGAEQFEINGGNAQRGAGVACYVVPLDDSAASRARPNFIKIDVEGAEVEVIRGGLRTIREHRPTLDIELHCALLPDRESALQDILQMLDGCGYRYSTTKPTENASALRRALLSRENAHLFCEP